MGKTELRIEIDSDLLAQAREAGLSVEALVEAEVRRALSGLERSHGLSDEAKAAQWVQDNAEAIEDYNRRVRERGLIGSEFRKW